MSVTYLADQYSKVSGRPIIFKRLFGSGMGSTGAKMIAKIIEGKLFATTNRER